MTSDGHDRLFVADGGNISLLDGTGAALHSWRVPKGVVTALATDGQKLWVGTDAGLMLADSNGLHPVSQSCGAIRDIEVADGKAYVLTAKAIHAANGYRLSTIARHDGLRLLAHDKRHVYAAGAYGKVYTLANDSLKAVASASDGQGFDIKALRCDGGGHLWILTDQTIREYDPVSGLARQLTIADDRIRMDNFGALCVTPKGVCVAGAGGLCMISHTASPGAHGKSDMPHIFDEYYQAGNAKLQADTQDPAPAMAGTGIGLSMTKKLVELYHGTIAVTSRESHGSTFTVTLPLAHVAVADKDEKAEAQTVTTAEEKRRSCILVVDDNVDFREFLANELSGEFGIVQACDGEEGLRMAHDHDVDIVVSDVMMPRMDGNEMCRRLKSDVKTSHIFVILLTARGGTESELSGYESGADAYITKPFNLAILRNRITHFLRLRQRQLEMMRQLMLNDVDKSQDGKDKAEAKRPVSIDDMPVSALDKQFLKQLMAKAEEHFSDPEYGVEAFSSDV